MKSLYLMLSMFILSSASAPLQVYAADDYKTEKLAKENIDLNKEIASLQKRNKEIIKSMEKQLAKLAEKYEQKAEATTAQTQNLINSIETFRKKIAQLENEKTAAGEEIKRLNQTYNPRGKRGKRPDRRKSRRNRNDQSERTNELEMIIDSQQIEIETLKSALYKTYSALEKTIKALPKTSRRDRRDSRRRMNR